MAQARREPRFSEMELLPPAQSIRAAQPGADNVINAVFETLPPALGGAAPNRLVANIGHSSRTPALGLLKRSSGASAATGAEGTALTPGFAAFTILAALAVFWLCGGHALLY